MSDAKVLASTDEILEMLAGVKTVAIVGASPKEERDSYKVAQYLKENGFTIYPINPMVDEILGEKAYASLDDLPGPVDVVDVFRRSEQVPAHAEEALRLKPKAFWMQLGVEHREAAGKLTDAGIDVVMDRCIKIEHGKIDA